MSNPISFFVIGVPATKGSAKGFLAGGHVRITNDCTREKPWAQQVHWAARDEFTGPPWEGPVAVEIVFLLPRPGRCGKRRCDVPADRKPDIDKLVRSILDSLTGVVFLDDSRVVQILARKSYADPGASPGALITVQPL